jgi:ABC-type multidrug transport system fused ATPase/permease subunit
MMGSPWPASCGIIPELGGSVSFYEILVIISLILWIIISVGLIASLLLLTPRLLQTLRKVDELNDLFTAKTIPLIENADRLLGEVSQVSTALVSDVEVVDRTVIRATESVERMVELAEERVSEINALLEVAMEEAEETFFSTAAILRALRVGGRKKKRRKLVGGERRRFG